ncbi:MAG TPA: hypothetical protein ENN47_13000 [Mesotoga infera]|uniref:SHOCT domain-containing protein n=1 Tax=Mesotoga infera TaxID=1236046 RepID=A0A7C1H1K4_9BACT|nr:hypothetical protein [Mesotoga infera]
MNLNKSVLAKTGFILIFVGIVLFFIGFAVPDEGVYAVFISIMLLLLAPLLLLSSLDFPTAEQCLTLAESKLHPGEVVIASVFVHRFMQGVNWDGKQISGYVKYFIVFTNYFLRMYLPKKKWPWQTEEARFSREDTMGCDTLVNYSFINAGSRRQDFSINFWTGSVVGFTEKEEDAYQLQQAADHILQRQRIGVTRGSTNLSQEIVELNRLMEEGLITEDEFGRAKELFLGKAKDDRDYVVKLLRNLYVLYKTDVLSESEFNMKKWDILSREK